MIYEYMEETEGVTKEELVGFREYIESEKYDTESLFYDIKQSNIYSSNILFNICSSNNSIFANTICQYIKHLQSMYIVNIFYANLSFLIFIYSQKFFV